MNLDHFQTNKNKGQKLSLVTCYDYSSARILSETNIDAFLVGDSVAMTIYGHNTTLPATVEMMAQHTEAVRRGLGPKRAIITDLPFLEHRGSLDRCLHAVKQLMVAGADAIKVEGFRGHESVIEHIIQSGVPVMGHLGLTPQFVHGLGGYRVQGRAEEQASEIFEQAMQLEKLGAFAIVLECVPNQLTERISQSLNIPTIGIGAGPSANGQILVMQDVLGMNLDFKPKFVRSFFETHKDWVLALQNYDKDVKSGQFPTDEESY